ncbi:MAG: hypothetical protein P8J14_04865 [Emcibacteraceae bacterium]|nr:hypothetical protein [Emcibacteraceae bacterium]
MMKQTQAQFKMLYGDEASWSKTTSAAFDVLFNGKMQVDAAKDHNVSTQVIGRFKGDNKVRHVERMEYATAITSDDSGTEL